MTATTQDSNTCRVGFHAGAVIVRDCYVVSCRSLVRFTALSRSVGVIALSVGSAACLSRRKLGGLSQRLVSLAHVDILPTLFLNPYKSQPIQYKDTPAISQTTTTTTSTTREIGL